MIPILGAAVFGIATVFTVLIVLGFPLGEFSMGGKYKVAPPSMRIACGVSVFVQLLAIMIIIQTGGIAPYWFSPATTQAVCFFFAAYLTLNTLMNLASRSKKERYVMTPLSIIAAACFWITALQA